MSPENNAERPKNSLGDALPSEALESMREQANGNLKEQIAQKIKTDIDSLTLAEKDPTFRDSQKIFQIKEELSLLLGRTSSLENPTEDEVKSLEAERETLSNRLSEAVEKIESPEPQTSTPPVETEKEISEQEKDNIVKEVLDAFREELKTSSFNVAEKSAQNKLRENARRLGESLNDQDYQELTRSITTEINKIEAEEKSKIKAAGETIPVQSPAVTPAEREPIETPPILNQEEVEALFGVTPEPASSPSAEEKIAAENIEAAKSAEAEQVSKELKEKALEIAKTMLEVFNQRISDFKVAKNDHFTNEEWEEEKRLIEDIQTEKLKELSLGDKELERLARKEYNKLVEVFPEVANENFAAYKSAETEIQKELLNQLNKNEIEPTPAEAEEILKIEKPEDVEQLPEATKEKISNGLWDLGFRIKEGVNGFIGEKIQNQADKRHKKEADEKKSESFFTRFLSSLAESYNKDARDAAQKRADVAAGGSKRLVGQSVYVGGRVLRYGRLLADAAGWTVGAPLAPFTRIATAVGMVAERGFDVAKEAQLRQEKFLEQDAEKAAEAAWEIYRELETTKDGATPTRSELDLAYKEKLPQDILQRLDKGKESGIASQTMQKLFGIWIEKSMQRMQENIANVENNSSIKPEDKERERQKIYNDYSIRLKDFDRALNETGTVDTAAMIFKLASSAGKWAVRLTALESLYMGGEKIFGKIADVLGQQTEADIAAIFERFEHEIGINSQDGLDKNEILKIDKIIKAEEHAGFPDRAEFIRSHYGSQIAEFYDVVIGVDSRDGLDLKEAAKITSFINEQGDEEFKKIQNIYGQMEIKGSNGLTLENLIEGEKPSAMPEAPPEQTPESAPSSSEPAPELPPAPKPKPPEFSLGNKVDIKPFRFENAIAGSGDSVWFSTEQSFRINPDRFGYNAAKDGDLNEWAKKKTAEVIKELADKKYGGKIPDLVHDGDKIIVEMGADGRPHIELEASSGMPLGHLPEKPLLTPPSPETSPAAPEIIPATPETKVGIEKFKDAWEKTSVDSRDSIVRQYVLGEMAKPEYTGHNFPALNQEKIDAYVQMFAGGDWDKIKTPEDLAQSLQDFDVNLKAYTRQLLEGKFDRNLSPQAFQELKQHAFPIESKNGKIFFTQFVDEGKWQLFEVDKQGVTHQLDRKKGFLGGKTQVFDTMHIRKFLRGH